MDLETALHVLETGDRDERFTAVEILHKAAITGTDIGAMLPALAKLKDDATLLPGVTNPMLALGPRVADTICAYHVKRGDAAAIEECVAAGGWEALTALGALRAASSEAELSPFVPLLEANLSSTDGPVDAEHAWSTRRRFAAMALAKLHWMKQDWAQVAVLLGDADEPVKQGVLAALDEVAGDAALEPSPVAPDLLRVLAAGSDASPAAREGAAKVLVWLVVRARAAGASAKAVLGDVDAPSIPEVARELELLREAAKKRG